MEKSITKKDALGRRRRPEQNRGLRSLFPKLPQDTQSRLVRIAMSSQAWEQLEQLVAAASAPTQPRAYGEVLEQLLDSLHPPRRTQSLQEESPVPIALISTAAEITPPTTDWQDWQARKELALLGVSLPS